MRPEYGTFLSEVDMEKTDQERHFETLRREIAVAVREQGDDLDENFMLRDAVRRARSSNMPDDYIADARRLGTTSDAAAFDQEILEGHASNGVAVIVELLTDDRRTSARDIEALFEEHGGSVGDDGCAAWKFERKGVVEVSAQSVEDADTFMLEAIELGVEELNEPVGSDQTYRLYCDPEVVESLSSALLNAGHDVESTSIVYEPKQRIPLQRDAARKFMQFFEKLRGREDVVSAHANWELA